MTSGVVRFAAVLVAAGRGTRFSASQSADPKQFVSLGGKPVYSWSLDVLLESEEVSQVVVVAPPDLLEAVQLPASTKPLTVIAGGATRQESVFLALKHLHSAAPSHVLVHDAARPFLSHTIIRDIAQTLPGADACTVGVPASDTVKRVSNGTILETIDRAALCMVQTPQAARFDLLYQAHARAEENQLSVTDDAALLEQAGVVVRLVPGTRFNLKITEPEDLILCEAIAGIFKSR